MSQRGRVLVAKIGLDGHDIGAKMITRALRDDGMEVIYTGLRNSPAEVARAAVDEDVEMIGLSILSGAHVELVRRLQAELEAQGVAGQVLLVVGGTIAPGDRPKLAQLGVAEAFTNDQPLHEIVRRIRELLESQRSTSRRQGTV